MRENYTDRKVKGKVLVHVMKTYREHRGIAPLILNLGARWTDQHHALGRNSGTR
jgi:hypothetical protein